MYKEETVNITLKVFDHNILGLQHHLEEHFNVISYKIMPKTERMYLEDDGFKKLVKAKKKLDREIGRYINDNKYKYAETE